MPARRVQSWLVVALILAAFLRVTWQLDGKNLWWDESLTLQRAELDFWPLLQGRLVMYDGYSEYLTIDQHPFFFFILQGLIIRLAGTSEYVLRFVSAASSTLLVPVVWAFGRLLVRRHVFSPTSPLWAALLAASSPFFLWYGQEARPYALWAFLAVLSTYLLARTTETDGLRWNWLGAYIGVMAMFLATHYYSVLLLPLHALAVYLWVAKRSRAAALLAALFLMMTGLLIGAVAAWLILVVQGGGANFAAISPDILVADLLNAFSLGLSVAIDRVWWLDLIFAAVLLAGTVWSLRSRRVLAAQGWLPAAMIGLPVGAILLLDFFQPVYMNARHLSLIGGAFILLLGGGLGLFWQLRPWLAGALALVLFLGSGYSTVNYFTLEEYAKDDYGSLSAYLDGRIMPGDLVLLKPPYSWRIFEYYLPLDEVDEAEARGFQIGQRGIPLLNVSWAASEAELERLSGQYRRIWLIISGTHPYLDLEEKVDRWFQENLFLLHDIQFFSHSSLKAKLYLPRVPVFDGLPADVQNSVDVVFGDQIRLAGYAVGEFASPELALPVSLYWQTLTPIDRRYKYILRLEEILENGELRQLAITEREPYDGAIPTTFWDEGVTILEYSEVPPPLPDLTQSASHYRLSLQMYDAETGDKLPVTGSGDGDSGADPYTASLRFAPVMPASPLIP